MLLAEHVACGVDVHRRTVRRSSAGVGLLPWRRPSGSWRDRPGTSRQESLGAQPRRQCSGALAERHRNALLARLPEDEDEDQQLRPRLRPVDLAIRDAVEVRGAPPDAVHFPIDAVISVVGVDGRGTEVEVTTIANEGVVGMHAFLGAAVNPFDTYCQVPGRALRLDVPDLHELLVDDSALHHLFRLSAQLTIAQLARNVLCHQLLGQR